MKTTNFFPLGKAYGKAFCNRAEETKWLVNNILLAKHSLLVAPRRFGKSSLAEKAIVEAKLPFLKINFHLCTNEREVAELILDGVIKLIGTAIGQIDKLINSIKKYATNLHPKLSFAQEMVSLELVPKQHTNYAVVIAEALMLLEKLLAEKEKRVVLFFDEFQELGKIKNEGNLEGAIRTAAQEMQNVALIFSGSIRSMLLTMFEDERRPLYKLCRKLRLDRINESDYHKHLNKIAQETWGKVLPEAVFTTIMQLSDRHPYYVNYLCDVLWENNNKLLTSKQVHDAWAIVVSEEWSDILKEISALSLTQRKVLKYIAQKDGDNIFAHEVGQSISLPTSTISSAITVLAEKDYIEIDSEKVYHITNPLLTSVLRNNFSDY